MMADGEPRLHQISLPEKRIEEARRSFLAGDARKARRLLQPLWEERGAEPAFAQLFADAALGEGAPDIALEAARRALQAAPSQSPDRAALLMRAAQAWLVLRKPREALLAALEAVENAPRDMVVAEIFGLALNANERFDQAIMVFREILEASPSPSSRACIGMIKALAGAGHLEAALEFGEACRELFPALHHIDVELARIQAAMRNMDAARARLLSLPVHVRETPDVLVLLGRLALQEHRDDEARQWFQRAQRLRPDDPYLRHLVESESKRASEDYVTNLFDSYAANFENTLISLGYRVPGLVLRALETHHEAFRNGEKLDHVLDLGCGTGLIGVVLYDRIGHDFVGVDLSENMLDIAKQKGLYTELVRKDINEYLIENTKEWHVIIAADVFCYFGELESVISLCWQRLCVGGLLLFSVEKGDEAEGAWVKGVTGRYRHAPSYVRGLLRGFDVLQCEETALRVDRGKAVEGVFVVARKM